VTAQALEQSVLESKDKEQLIAIAKALGLKPSARNKKSDIIGQIIDLTGGSSAPAPAPERARAAESVPEPEAEPTPASARVLDEPKAEWELATESDAGEASPTTEVVPSNGSSQPSDAPAAAIPAGDRPNGGQPRSADGDRGPRNNNPNSQPGNQPGNRDGGNQPGNRDAGNRDGGNRDGGNRGPGQQNNNPSAGGDEDGAGRNSRRRRRRKGGRGGQDGPQGEDRDLIVADDDGGAPISNEPIQVEGYLDMRDEGYGFMRVNGYLSAKTDPYIPVKLARQYGLRKGDHVLAMSRPARRDEKNPPVHEILKVNGRDPEDAKKRRRFEDLTALFPDSRLRMSDPADPTNMTARIIDLICPIGKGQRGIIVSPPKAGKTTVMKTIATSIEKNHPEVKLIVLLIDERPEEVTDMRRTVRGEVISSTFDRPSEQHTQIAELTIEKAKRMVEYGEDVVVILDGITRLSRAYNLAAPSSGKILSGGIDAGALYPPKRFFGAARNVEEGGSLTILATALVETNSRMDEAVFEEFKGTGNMELRLDRRLAERRIYPAIDVDASSTRHEELLFDRAQLQMVWKLRRVLSGLAADGNAAPGLELLVDRLKTFRTNEEFLTEIAKQPGM
jgi:transcription termination factor Rho